MQGYNCRLDPLQAAVLLVKLKYLDSWNTRRGELAQQYLAGLEDTGLVLPHVPTWADPVWHLFVIRHPRRDELQAQLSGMGIDTLIHYPIPPHRQDAYADAGLDAGDYPIASRMAEESLSLPISPHHSSAHIDAVVAAIRKST